MTKLFFRNTKIVIYYRCVSPESSREMEPIGCVDTQKNSKVLVYMTMEADKSQDLQWAVV